MIPSGTLFPTAIDAAHYREIADLRRLWQSRHEEIYTRILYSSNVDDVEALRRKWAALNYVEANLLGQLSANTAEALALEPATISSDAAQPAVDELRRASDWDALVLTETERSSALGEMAYKIIGDPVRIVAVEPESVFRGEDYIPEIVTSDLSTTRAPMIATLHQDDQRYVVLFELHQAGRVDFFAHEWTPPPDRRETVHTLGESGTLGAEVDPREVRPDLPETTYPTPLDVPSLFVVRNEPDPFDPRHGRTDYTRDLRALQGEFEEKLSVVLRHFDELVSGGSMILPEGAKAMVMRRGPRTDAKRTDFGRNIASSGNLPTIDTSELAVYFESAEDKGVARFVARTPQYEGGMKSLELILAVFEKLSRCTLDPLFERATAPESGRAMRLARHRDRSRILRKHARYAGPLARLFEAALAFDGVVVDDVTYEFPEPFPTTDMERAEVAQLRVGGPTLSLESALVEVFGYTQEEAQAEAGRITSAQHVAGLSVGRGLFKPASPDEFTGEGPAVEEPDRG